MSRGTRVKTAEHHFRSKFEASVYGIAKAQRKKLEYEPDDAIINYNIDFRYKPDWRLPNGILVESKGHLDQWDRRKHLAIKAQYPEIEIRFVFQSANRKLSRHGMTYAEWADKNGFVYSEGSIPIEWYKEKL